MPVGPHLDDAVAVAGIGLFAVVDRPRLPGSELTVGGVGQVDTDIEPVNAAMIVSQATGSV